MNDKTPYELIGGAERVRELVDRFYDHMDSHPDASGIRAMHARSLRASREKLYLFLSGWLGGPDLYVQKYGHPRLRQRHLPFTIGRDERDQWLMCMEQALDEMSLDPALRNYLSQNFWRTADHMRNKPEGIAHGQTLPIFSGPRPGSN